MPCCRRTCTSAISCACRLGEADRQETRGSHQRAGQHGERGRSPGKGGRSCPIPALFHLHDHLSMAMIASSTSNPSAMMRAPSVMRWRSRPVAYITSSTIASTTGTDSAPTMPVRQPSDRKLTTSTMTSASANVSTNSETDSLTMWDWVTSIPNGSSLITAFIAEVLRQVLLPLLTPQSAAIRRLEKILTEEDEVELV